MERWREGEMGAGLKQSCMSSSIKRFIDKGLRFCWVRLAPALFGDLTGESLRPIADGVGLQTGFRLVVGSSFR